MSRAAVTTLPAYTVDEPNSPKTHTLFMGIDVAINVDGKLYHVEDVVGSDWVVEIGGRERRIPSKGAPLKMSITPSLKLTEASVVINGLTDMRGFSFDNDPATRLTRSLSQGATTYADFQYNANQAAAVTDGTYRLVIFATNFNKTHPDAYLGGVGTDMSRLNTMNHVANENELRQVNSAGKDMSIGGKEVQPKGLDAVDVDFELRTGKLLQNPYVITLTRFRAKDAKPRMVQDLVFAQSLHPIDEHSSHVHFVEEGFPYGFELLDFQLHIYDRGKEIATNVAADRVEMTREEAFEYVKAEYVGAHSRDTLPAEPAMGKLPSDLRTRLAAGQYRATYYVVVSKDGLAEIPFLDSACTQRVEDPYLMSVVQSLRFKPALENGKPVSSTASLDLNKLPL